MFKYILNSFWLDFQLFPHFVCYLIGVAICDIIMFANLLFHNDVVLGLGVCLVAAFSAITTVKMYSDGMDESHHDVYLIYMMLSEILSGAIFLHLAWWIFKIPLTVIEYRKDSK